MVVNPENNVATIALPWLTKNVHSGLLLLTFLIVFLTFNLLPGLSGLVPKN
jgi:hypothetical protein